MPSPPVVSGYKIVRHLGRGSTADVYHARHILSGRTVAIKIVRRFSKAAIDAIESETAAMRRLDHPHILRLIDVLSSPPRTCFVLELAKGGDLFDPLKTIGSLSESLARKYFRQLVSAVEYCHSQGVVHRDIKLENVLLDEGGNVLLSDFGLSSTAASGTLLHTVCGTPSYMAPEILEGKGYYGPAVDVWSCGILLFVLTAAEFPFNDPNPTEMVRKISRGQYKCPTEMSPDLRRLISRLLDTNPQTRITVDEIKQDVWFCGGGEGGGEGAGGGGG